MATSYENRLIRANQLDSFLDFSRVFGQGPAMVRWGFRNDISIAKLYEKYKGDGSYGRRALVKYPYLQPGQTGWDYLKELMIGKFLEANAKLQQLEAERKQDKELIAHLTEGQEDDLALGLIELFKLAQEGVPGR